MFPTVTMRLEKAIASVNLIDESSKDFVVPSSQVGAAKASQVQAENLAQVCEALRNAVGQITDSQRSLVEKYKEEIAKLSVEIARRILIQKVQEGDYQIESIVKAALDHAPTHKDIVVRLNPQDLVECRKAQQADSGEAFAGIKFVGDANIGRAECVVESPKGVMESLIGEHLERISKALEKAE